MQEERERMQLYTRYVYEKDWKKTSEKDALRIIKEELGDYDPQGTLRYLIEETAKGKTITVGECRFKAEKG